MPIRDRDERRKYQREWRAARRAEFFAGKCCRVCESTEDLELDHIDPRDKVHHGVWSWSQARREAELAKCQVLCSRCHKLKTTLFKDRKRGLERSAGQHKSYAKPREAVISRREAVQQKRPTRDSFWWRDRWRTPNPGKHT